MKLADNFKEFLILYQGRDFANKRMKDLFVFEEGDLEKYPESRWFIEDDWSSGELLGRMNDFKRQFGFFRKKNSPAEILVQKDIEERFPFKAILKVWHIRQTLIARRIAEESANDTLNRFQDLPEEEFLNELNKEED